MHVQNIQGVDLRPSVRDFYISTQTFTSSSGDVKDGVVTPGTHTVLRFDTIITNMGTSDLAIGDPARHPDLFVWSSAHGHYHFKDFNKYTLTNIETGELYTSAKQSFCLEDSVRVSTASTVRSEPYYSCSKQGISAGWADVYQDNLPGQYVVIDGIHDGIYRLNVTTDYGRLIPETNEGNNTIQTALSIQGGVVRVVNSLIVGTSANDTLTGTSAADTMLGLGGTDQLSGASSKDELLGGSGNDVLNGGSGSDTLQGGLGADTFFFKSSLTKGTDMVKDFSHADDTIQLENAVFTGLSTGQLARGAFTTLSAAAQADDRIIYDQPTGRLFFDADGGTRDDLVHFATLTTKPLDLAADDFLVV